MRHLDWILVLFGACVAGCGALVRAYPERLCAQLFPASLRGLEPDEHAMGQIRLLGGSVLFMGAFFAVQMSADLLRLPWWCGSLGGLAVSVAALGAVNARIEHRQRRAKRTPLNPRAAEAQ